MPELTEVRDPAEKKRLKIRERKGMMNEKDLKKEERDAIKDIACALQPERDAS